MNCFKILNFVACGPEQYFHFFFSHIESTQSSKLSASSIPLTVMVLLLSWVSAFLPPVFVSLLVTHAGWSLSWYCRPYLAVMLYGIPALVGLALVHCLLRWFYTSKVLV